MSADTARSVVEARQSSTVSLEATFFPHSRRHQIFGCIVLVINTTFVESQQAIPDPSIHL